MDKFQIILGEAVRIEYNQDNGELFLVFKIVDETFKQEILRDWTQEIELKISEKRKLVLNE